MNFILKEAWKTLHYHFNALYLLSTDFMLAFVFSSHQSCRGGLLLSQLDVTLPDLSRILCIRAEV